MVCDLQAVLGLEIDEESKIFHLLDGAVGKSQEPTYMQCWSIH